MLGSTEPARLPSAQAVLTCLRGDTTESPLAEIVRRGARGDASNARDAEPNLPATPGCEKKYASIGNMLKQERNAGYRHSHRTPAAQR